MNDGLHVSGGDVGLIQGEGYGDYRFEFDLTIPVQGAGVAGWVVRAADENNCIMFQLQSADSTLNAPQFKTKPNTLRPHVRRNGQWTVLEPVALPKEVRRGEAHTVATECRGKTIEVFLDGAKIHGMPAEEFTGGPPGFRAGSAEEAGIFRKVAVRK